MMNSLGLKAKLVSICTGIASFIIVVGGVSLWLLNDVATKYDLIAENNLPKTKLLGDILFHFRQVRIDTRSTGLDGLTKTQIENYIAKALSSAEKLGKANDEYLKTPFAPGEKELHAKMWSGWQDFLKFGATAFEVAKSPRPEDRAILMEKLITQCPKEAAPFEEAIAKLVDFQSADAQKSVAAAKDSGSTGRVLTLGIMGVTLSIWAQRIMGVTWG